MREEREFIGDPHGRADKVSIVREIRVSGEEGRIAAFLEGKFGQNHGRPVQPEVGH